MWSHDPEHKGTTPMHINPDLASHVDIPIDPNKDVLSLGRCIYVMAWTRRFKNRDQLMSIVYVRTHSDVNYGHCACEDKSVKSKWNAGKIVQNRVWKSIIIWSFFSDWQNLIHLYPFFCITMTSWQFFPIYSKLMANFNKFGVRISRISQAYDNFDYKSIHFLSNLINIMHLVQK